MFIFLDESYNLKDRSKPQFISINGFATISIKRIWKHWKIQRRQFVNKARIHATDKRFEYLRKKSIDLVGFLPEANILTAFQAVSELPLEFYYKKGRLVFNKVYEDLLKELLSQLHLQEYKKVIIIIDSRKHKSGQLGKLCFRENILAYLKQNYPNTVFRFDITPSTSNILIEVADFISNTFYKKYTNQQIGYLDSFRSKIIEIKNPLKKRG